jgi:hypothetical protein
MSSAMSRASVPLLVSSNTLLAGRTLIAAVRPSSLPSSAPFLTQSLARLHAWRRKTIFKEEDSDSSMRVRRALKGFSLRDFGALARARYTSLLSSVSTHDEATLKSLLSPAALSSVRAGWLQARGRIGASIESWDEVSSVVVASAAKAGIQASGSLLADVPDDFVQIAFRAVTIQKEIKQDESNVSASARFQKNSPRMRTDVQTPPSSWLAVDDEATGSVYYWDRVSGNTRWTPPRASEFTAAGSHLPFSLANAGSSREPIGEGGRGGVRVQHTITFEKCTKDGQRSADWYIVGL